MDENVPWEVNVIQLAEVNAFVLPGGKIFVFTGLIPIARGDEGLATILSHEIAHLVARHSAEKYDFVVGEVTHAFLWISSRLSIFQLVNIMVVMLSMAVDLSVLVPLAVQYGFALPFSRQW